jgi:hypothetical protein
MLEQTSSQMELFSFFFLFFFSDGTDLAGRFLRYLCSPGVSVLVGVEAINKDVTKRLWFAQLPIGSPWLVGPGESR